MTRGGECRTVLVERGDGVGEGDGACGREPQLADRPVMLISYEVVIGPG